MSDEIRHEFTLVGYNRKISQLVLYDNGRMIVVPLQDWHGEDGAPMSAEEAPLASFQFNEHWFELDFDGLAHLSVH